MRIVVCGSRGWLDKARIRSVLLEVGPATIVDGGARGADELAHAVAVELGWPTERFFAGWKNKGKAAGFIRNQEMVSTKPDMVIAFWDGQSRGTQDTIRRAEAAGIPTRVVRYQRVL